MVSEALYPAVPSLDGPHAQQRRAHTHVSELLARVRLPACAADTLGSRVKYRPCLYPDFPPPRR